ncbi:LacI family DNA-binding transcriptional regulator [Streptomyces sp. NPDC058576]|uniref:LacI family DNA-binding transcriptional regulator n=1 Tax=Streptomyces sp. NPDC058576 TaxID=3346547 RepID=UPI00365BC0AA
MPQSDRSGRPRRSAPTVRDVAARAGVSPMTVSRVLRGEPRVSPSTRTRVLAAVDELGYRLDEVARSLRLGRASGLLGLVVTNLANPFYSRLALGAEEVARHHGLRLVLGSTGGEVRREAELTDDLVSRRVDGMIVVPAASEQTHLDAETLRGTPLVLASRPPSGIEADTVLVDDFGGARAGAAQLVRDGHTSVGFLGNPPGLFTGAERFRGWRAALEEAGVPVRDAWVRRDARDIGTAQAAALDLLERSDAPTALFCATNRLTLGAYRAVRQIGTGTALAGFDAVELADVLEGPLLIVSYDADEIGRRAARLLIDRVLAEPGTPVRPARRSVVPTTLVRYGVTR